MSNRDALGSLVPSVLTLRQANRILLSAQKLLLLVVAISVSDSFGRKRHKFYVEMEKKGGEDVTEINVDEPLLGMLEEPTLAQGMTQ